MEICCGESGLGCSVVEITALDGRFEYASKKVRTSDGWGGFYNEYEMENVNLFTSKDGYAKFRSWVDKEAGTSSGGYGGIALFCDTSTDDKGGHKLAAILREHGEQVEESEAYKNPRHSGKCTLWVWYFRKKPDERPLPAKRLPAARSVPKPRRKAKL